MITALFVWWLFQAIPPQTLAEYQIGAIARGSYLDKYESLEKCLAVLQMLQKAAPLNLYSCHYSTVGELPHTTIGTILEEHFGNNKKQ